MIWIKCVDHKLFRDISVLFYISLAILTFRCVSSSSFLLRYTSSPIVDTIVQQQTCSEHTHFYANSARGDCVKSHQHFDQTDLLRCVLSL